MTTAKKAIEQLWADGFFRPPHYRLTPQVEREATEKYGCTYANWGTLLSRSSFLRRTKNGWIQKKPYIEGEIEHETKGGQLKDLLNNTELWEVCKSSFNNGDDWDACLHALRHLETKIRKRANFSAQYYGTDLVTKAFDPEKGVLRIPSCATKSEEQGFLLINMGFVMFHRNAKGHREGTIDRKAAIKIISYVDYLLDVLKTAENR